MSHTRVGSERDEGLNQPPFPHVSNWMRIMTIEINIRCWRTEGKGEQQFEDILERIIESSFALCDINPRDCDVCCSLFHQLSFRFHRQGGSDAKNTARGVIELELGLVCVFVISFFH